MDIVLILMQEFHLRREQVENTIKLIDEGCTIPFIARYRKEVTGSLDDQLLRSLFERLEYLRGLDARRGEIEKSLTEQNVLTDELREKLAKAATLAELEDIYRPYRPKRHTRASIAREKGLEPLAQAIFLQNANGKTPEELAEPFVNAEKEVADVDAALQGARDIIAEMISDDAEARRLTKMLMRARGQLESKNSKDEKSVYEMYYDHSEPVSKIPDHRILAVNRGEKEEFLKVRLLVSEDEAMSILRHRFVTGTNDLSKQVETAAQDAWDRLIEPSIEREIRSELTERAGTAAVRVFASNLHQLLMQPPVKGRVTLGVDPGFRTGCKLAVVSEEGRVLETGVGHFTIPGQTRQKEQAKELILGMVRRHGVTAIAIGNGTASRESEQFIASILPEMPAGVAYAIVSEAGASVYSASKLGAEEFPQYDVSLRSAVSIARRLQDPLAELVKIEPRAIGVGQYQHDLKEAQLDEALSGVVESCVNAVGVDVETASAALLSHVSGINSTIAKNIVAYRDENGITSRAQLKKVPRLGPKAFEQCAGFLRVSGSKNVLDSTVVHPESYDAAKALLEKLGYTLADVRGGSVEGLAKRAEEKGIPALAKELGVGEPTLKDIIAALMKPGRDPRDELPPQLLRTDVMDMNDLKPGMELKGTVRNVIDFGAFVDIGVHQDGLVHITQMADRFVKNPGEIVKVGDVVTVWVLSVDLEKKRISLTMKKPKG